MRAVSLILILGVLSACASVNTPTDAVVHTAGAVADAGVLAGVSRHQLFLGGYRIGCRTCHERTGCRRLSAKT